MPPLHHAPLETSALAELLPAYEFVRQISSDASGEVFEARHRSLDREVAIRILPLESGADPGFRERFQEKSRAMARLSHPSLIRIYDSGEVGGRWFTVMEHVPGESLRACAHGKAIDPRQAVEILIAAARGLAHAHENGVVHGDIRPENLFITPRCEPKIGNFGISTPSGSSTFSEYFPPVRTGRAGDVDPQADVFALGVILQELLTGIPAGAAQGARATISDARLDALCRKATHPDPSSRHADAASFAADLNSWMTSAETIGQPVRAMAPRPAAVVRRPVAPMAQPTASVVKKPPAAQRFLVKFGLFAVSLVAAAGWFHGSSDVPQDRSARQDQELRSSSPVAETSAADAAGLSIVARRH